MITMSVAGVDYICLKTLNEKKEILPPDGTPTSKINIGGQEGCKGCCREIIDSMCVCVGGGGGGGGGVTCIRRWL